MAFSSDAVKVIKLEHRCLQREHLERKALVQVFESRLPPKTLSKLTRHVLSEVSVPVHGQ